MNITDKIIKVLKYSQNSFKLEVNHQLSKLLDANYEGTFLLQNRHSKYKIKWFDRDEKFGLREIKINKEIMNKISAPVPKLIFATKTSGGYVACWEWIEGISLKTDKREFLPEAFKTLGKFHLSQKYTGPVHSLFTIRNYKSIHEMIKHELEVHCSYLRGGQKIKEKCAPILSILEKGYPTLVHGDLHTGNIIKNKDIYFIDWANAHKGLNLNDLENIHSVPLETEAKNPWSVIHSSEAYPVLKAYFKSSGLNHLDIKKTHFAVMLFTQLRRHSYGVEDRYQVRIKTARKNIDQLLNL